MRASMNHIYISKLRQLLSGIERALVTPSHNTPVAEALRRDAENHLVGVEPEAAAHFREVIETALKAPTVGQLDEVVTSYQALDRHAEALQSNLDEAKTFDSADPVNSSDVPLSPSPVQ